QFGVDTQVSAPQDDPSERTTTVVHHTASAAACGVVLLKGLPLLGPVDRRFPLLVADRGAIPAHDRARCLDHREVPGAGPVAYAEERAALRAGEQRNVVEFTGGVAAGRELAEYVADETGHLLGHAGAGAIHAAGLVEQPEHRAVLVVGEHTSLAGPHDQRRRAHTPGEAQLIEFMHGPHLHAVQVKAGVGDGGE